MERFDDEHKGPRPATRRWVDHFQIVRLVGRGATGEVYLARDTRLGRKVALKLIHPHLVGTRRAAERLMAEARATARFSHPHIVHVYGVGEHEGRPYLALEFLAGQTLRERMAGERPSVRETTRIGLAIADALTEAHQHRISHRDLKPENVLLPRDGRLRVVDFGLARPLGKAAARGEAPSGVTTTDTFDPPGLSTGVQVSRAIRGTPAYMAPELWRMEDESGAADVWALGVILFELLAGRRPFPQTTVEALAGAVASLEPAPALRQAAPDAEVPEVLAQLVDRCLDKEPYARPSAAEVAEELGRLVDGWRRGKGESEESPFRGLLPFGERHAEHFFGREAEIAEVAERLREVPVMPVVGASGAGKSSFVRAGLIPRLREQGRLVVLRLRPGARPFSTLAARLVAGDTESAASFVTPSSRSEARREGDEEALARSLALHPERLSLELHGIAEATQGRVLLVVDQLEEVFTLAAGDEGARTAERFMRALCLAADDHQDPVRVVFTLRDDYLGRVAGGPEVRRALSRLTVLRAPGPDQLVATLVGPLTTLGYAFDDPSLPGEMVEEVESEPACLPLLQFAARMLWERRDREQRRITRAAYEALGGVAGALAVHADGVLEGLSPREVGLAREVLLRLVTGEGTRRVVPRSRLLEGLAPAAEDVLGRLVEARLVSLRKSGGEGAAVEVAHESLLTTWGRLARWIDESRAELELLAELQSAAELWERRGERDEEVWHGDALADARGVVDRAGNLAPELVRRFVEAGRRLGERKARRRRAAWVVGTLVLAVIAIVSVVLALAFAEKERVARAKGAEAERQSETARARWAEAQREGARAALARGDVLEARSKLRGSLEKEDSTVGRALWWRLSGDAQGWRLSVGAAVHGVALSPDGRWVAAASQDHTVYLIDSVTRETSALRGHSDQVSAVDFAPDGRRLATATLAGDVGIWDLASGSLGIVSAHEAPIWDLDWGPSGAIASVSFDRTARLIRPDPEAPGEAPARGATLGAPWRHEVAVSAVAFDEAGGQLATGGRDGVVRVWDVAKARVVAKRQVHEAGVTGVGFAGDRIVSASFDKTVRAWTPGGEVETLGAHAGPVTALALGDGVVASGSTDREIRIWREGGQLERTLLGHREKVQALAFGPEGRLASASHDKTARLWVWQRARGQAAERGHTDVVNGVSVAPDGAVVASASYDQSVRLWDAETGAQLHVLRGHGARVYDVRFDPSGRWLGSAGGDNTVRLWRAGAAAEDRVLVGHRDRVYALAWGPQGRFVASAGADRTVRLWDPATGAQLTRLDGHEGSVHGVAVSPDGSLIASVGEAVRLWTRDGMVREMSGHEGEIIGVAFGPQGRRVATGGEDGTLRLWDVLEPAGRVLGRYPARVYKVAFSAEGRLLAAACSDGSVRVLDLAVEGGRLVTLSGHHLEANAVAFAADGRLATAGDDGTVRLWDALRGAGIWRGVGAGALAHTHRGWAFGGARRQPWAGALEGARLADEGCVLSGQGTLRVWQGEASAVAEVAGVRRLLRGARGCVTLGGDGMVALWDASGASTQLAADASAVGVGEGGEILLGSAEALRVMDPSGREKARYRGASGLSALAGIGPWLVLGFDNGNLELVPREGAEGARGAFEGGPARPVVKLLAGPMGTVIAGYASGHLAIWDLSSGALVHQSKLHGALEHLYLSPEGGRLYATSVLGDTAQLDLSVFEADYCEVLREVWSQVPTLWEEGVATRRAAPGDHRCSSAESR